MPITEIDVASGAVESPLVVLVLEDDDALDCIFTELGAKSNPLGVQVIVCGMDFQRAEVATLTTQLSQYEREVSHGFGFDSAQSCNVLSHFFPLLETELLDCNTDHTVSGFMRQNYHIILTLSMFCARMMLCL